MENEMDTNREGTEKRNPVLRLRLQTKIIQQILRKGCDWIKLSHNRDQGPGCCTHNNNPAISIKCREILEKPSNC